MTDSLANASAVTSAGVAAATWLVELELWLQVGASVVAIIAGLAAAVYHIDRVLNARRERNGK